MTLSIRPATGADHDAIWEILAPIIAAGETLALARDATRAAALDYWCPPGTAVFVAERDGRVAGTFAIRANRGGGGAHVANASYAVATHAAGQGIGRVMGAESLMLARAMGFTAIQFNFVVASNTRAVALWRSLGFDVVGRLPRAFIHPELGAVDALVMFRALDDA